MQANERIQPDRQAGFLDQFEDVVRRSPGAVALVYEDQQLTYAALDQYANQIAHHLAALGVGPDVLVGISVERSLDMVAGILGILKAGGAYVPLDPAYPKDRLAFILEDSQARVVITQCEHAQLFTQPPVQTVCLDTQRAEIEQRPREAPARATRGDNLIYVIYTSGSTGQPKGVMITHSNVANFIRIAGEVLDVNADDVYLQSASISYALSVRQIAIPLARGAAVVIASAEQLHDPLLLFQLIKARQISIMDVVPSFWRSCYQRLASLPAAEARSLLDNSLRRIVSIGEALLSDLPQDWAALAGDRTRLVNIFGQTETTGVVATYPIPRETPARPGIVPIGRSVTDTRIYLLGPDLQPVPDGEQGELCVSNPCVGLGYLNRPDLNREKFIPNPFQDGLSPRLYRTGDMARLREDGNIEYLGRGDSQVKIRGQRVEPGEVESVLRRHPQVQDCVVMARGSSPDDRYLAAYIVPAAGSALTTGMMRAYASSRLPGYMVPGAFIFLESMPLTPNGKTDRLALPEPKSIPSTDAHAQTGSAQVSEAVETTLLAIWKELMGSQPVGLEDNFFELGGHSLMAIRLFARIEQALGVRLPVTLLIEHPTVARLAKKIQESRGLSTDPILVPLQTSGKRRPFFLVHGVGGGVLGYRDLVNALSADQPVYGLQAAGMNEPCDFDQDIEGMAARYIQAMRAHQPDGPYQLGGYCFGGMVAFEMARQLEQQGQSVSLLAIFEGYLPNETPFNLPFRPRLAAIFEHIPYWYRDYSRMTPKDLWHRVEGTITKIKMKLQHHPEYSRRIRVQEILDMDLAQVPERSVELTQVNSSAFHRYVPGIYAGAVTLFRARVRSFNEVLFGAMDATMGWTRVAAGGVRIRYVNGYHRNIHLPPYVSSLAAELNDCLERNNP